eukprot:1155857-Pelagomonas_calceolata.AAC.7
MVHIYTPHTFEPLEKLCLDTHKANKLALKFLPMLSSRLLKLRAPGALLTRLLLASPPRSGTLYC